MNKNKIVCYEDLQAAIGDGKTLTELAEEMGLIKVGKFPKQELCDVVQQAIADGKVIMGPDNKIKLLILAKEDTRVADIDKLTTIEIIINGTERVKQDWTKQNIEIDHMVFSDMSHAGTMLAKALRDRQKGKILQVSLQKGKIEVGPATDENKKLIPNGWSHWVEDGMLYKAKTVDAKKFGGHTYDNGGFDQGVRDCVCGCSMGSFNCFGFVDPFGPCPANQK